MRDSIQVLSLTAVILLAVIAAGCEESNPISAFQPEIVNNPDAFEFQITEANNVTTTLSYSWSNSGTQASIDHSTVVVDGIGTIVLLDASGTQVYSSQLKASGTDQGSAGSPGIWTIQVTFAGFDGTSNFRVQKL